MAYDDAPTEEVFNEIKEAAIEIWRTYDDTYGYATEKITQVQSITNVRDNWGYIVGMFDPINQSKLLAKLSPEAQATPEPEEKGISIWFEYRSSW